MNRTDLAKKLKKERVPTSWYCLDVDEYNDGLALHHKDGLWEVFYGERGIKNDIKTFDTEEEACGYLYEEIMDDMKYL
ncbi:MAG: hypothetical protein FWH04_09425 [Oscillospiraceae bacterium]|nr:hypothetical protein [Oscillospiraceae bacterium]